MGDIDVVAVDVETGGRERHHLRLALGLSASTQLLMSFTSTATNIAFPSIQSSFTTPRTTLAWGITGFAIVQASLLLVCGRVGDRVGHKRVYLRGLAVFTIGSLGAAAAPIGESFLVARLVQAVGAAMVVPAALALAMHEFPTGRRVWVATMSAGIMSVGQAASPTVGSLLIEVASWRAVYVWPAVLCAVIGALARDVFRDPVVAVPVSGRIDALGVVMSSVGIAALAFAMTKGPQGWTRGEVLIGLVVAGALIPGVLLRSARHPTPVLDPALLRIRSVWSSSVVGLLSSAIGFGAWVVWPLLLVEALGYSTLEAGLLLTPVPAIMAMAALASSRVIDRGGPRLIVLVGLGAWIVGLTVLLLSRDSSPDYLRELLPGMSICGIGYGCTMGSLTGLALSDVDATRLGQTNALVGMVRFVGGALGSALAIGIIGDRTPLLVSRFDLVHLLFLIVACVAASVAATCLPRRVSVVRPLPESIDGLPSAPVA